MDSKWKMDPLFSTIEILIMRPPTKMAPPPPVAGLNRVYLEAGSGVLIWTTEPNPAQTPAPAQPSPQPSPELSPSTPRAVPA